jgi:hypothetical protein
MAANFIDWLSGRSSKFGSPDCYWLLLRSSTAAVIVTVPKGVSLRAI